MIVWVSGERERGGIYLLAPNKQCGVVQYVHVREERGHDRGKKDL